MNLSKEQLEKLVADNAKLMFDYRGIPEHSRYKAEQRFKEYSQMLKALEG